MMLFPALRASNPLFVSLFSFGSLWKIPSFLDELFPRILLAVPKKKVSHSRKAMRAANKGLKDKHNIVNCPACGGPKLAHHLCPSCYSSLSKLWKSIKKDDGHNLSA